MSIDLGGTIRDERPEETIKRARRVFPLVGITRVANITGLDTVGVPVWLAVRPLGWSLSVSQGKGLTHELAAASAIMESIEVCHAERAKPDGLAAPLTAYTTDSAFVPLSALPLHVDASKALDPVIHWARGRSIISGRERLIPSQLFNMDFWHADNDKAHVIRSTNGLASGNTYDEAVLHAVCELIERDQQAFFAVARSLAPCTGGRRRLALSSISEPLVTELIERILAAGLKVFLWYATTTIAVPCFVCTVADLQHKTPYAQQSSGFGCHPLKSVAVSRAITEALQSRLTYIAGVRDDVDWDQYVNLIDVRTESNIRWFRTLLEEEEDLDYDEIPAYSEQKTVSAMLKWTCIQLERAGLPEVIAVDLSDDGIGIPVVYVCVPQIQYAPKKGRFMPGERMTEFYARLARE